MNIIALFAVKHRGRCNTNINSRVCGKAVRKKMLDRQKPILILMAFLIKARFTIARLKKLLSLSRTVHHYAFWKISAHCNFFANDRLGKICTT